MTTVREPTTGDRAATDLTTLYRDALKAAFEGLNIPDAATIGWDEHRQRILDRRLSHVMVMLQGVLEADPTEMLAGRSLISHRVDWLREWLAEHPPTGYVTAEEAKAAIERGMSWAEAVAEPRDCQVCGPGCCRPFLGIHGSPPGPHSGARVVSVR